MKTITEKNAAKLVQQFNAENLNHHRAAITGEGWQDIKICPKFLELSVKQISDLLGGKTETRDRIKHNLKNVKLNHWGLQRFIWNGKRWNYCAGQSYTEEINDIRNFLKK